jgi:hypothetical protein
LIVHSIVTVGGAACAPDASRWRRPVEGSLGIGVLACLWRLKGPIPKFALCRDDAL